MSIEHMDNFSIYGVGAAGLARMTNGVWAETAGGIANTDLVADPDGESPGYVLKAAPSAFSPYQSSNRYILAAVQPIVGIATRYWMSRVPGANVGVQRIADFRNAANANVCTIYVDATGAICAGVYDVNNVMHLAGQSDGPAIGANAWWHIEMKVDTTNGKIEVRVEGAPVFALTGIAFANISTGIAQVAFVIDGPNGSLNATTYWKDLVIWNGTGAHNNDFMGSVIVYSLTPNADIVSPWTITGGATASGVLANIPPQDTADYIAADYPGIPAAVKVGLTDLPSTVTTVRGLMTVVRAKKVDGGDGDLQNGIISAGVTGEGTNRPITAAFSYWRDVFEVDPATTNPWTLSGANAAELTINRTL